MARPGDGVGRKRLEKIVLETVNKVGESRGRVRSRKAGLTTRLYGKGGLLDSLGMVTLILELEERVSAECGRDIVIADEKAFSRKKSPFRDIETLVSYISDVLSCAAEA